MAMQDMQGMEDAPEAPAMVICIAAQADGTFSVYEEGEPQDSPDAGAQTAENIDDALEMVRQMISGESEEPPEQGEPQDANAPLSGDDAKRVWNEMATSRKR